MSKSSRLDRSGGRCNCLDASCPVFSAQELVDRRIASKFDDGGPPQRRSRSCLFCGCEPMQAASCALARQSSGEREETVLKITARKLHRSLVLPTAHPFVGHAEDHVLCPPIFEFENHDV